MTIHDEEYFAGKAIDLMKRLTSLVLQMSIAAPCDKQHEVEAARLHAEAGKLQLEYIENDISLRRAQRAFGPKR